MRRLMLLRHAKSDWSTAGQRDIERTLAPRGRAAAPVVARYMAQHGLAPDLAVVSSARRTRETWDLMENAFAAPPASRKDTRVYEASPRALMDVIAETPPDIHTLLLVGHNPGLQEVATYLIGRGDEEARRLVSEKFPTAALAVIDFASDDWTVLKRGSGRLDRFVTPRALKVPAE